LAAGYWLVLSLICEFRVSCNEENENNEGNEKMNTASGSQLVISLICVICGAFFKNSHELCLGLNLENRYIYYRPLSTRFWID